MKVLQVIDQAFRTTTEEQDDTILWLTQSMQSTGANLMLLLSGHGVQYAALRKLQPALSIGLWQQSQPADIYRDLTNLIEHRVPVYVVDEDLSERGLDQQSLIAGIKSISRNQLVDIYEQADQVWHW